jgi:hypothetical protein
VKAALGLDASGIGNQITKAVYHDEAPWVAEITGHHPTYRYRREFLPHKVDYRRSDGSAKHGITWWWIIESDHVYEISTAARHGKTRQLVTVTDAGDIIPITCEEVDQWLSVA